MRLAPFSTWPPQCYHSNHNLIYWAVKKNVSCTSVRSFEKIHSQLKKLRHFEEDYHCLHCVAEASAGQQCGWPEAT